MLTARTNSRKLLYRVQVSEKKKIQGFSLIEFLIASALGIIVIAATSAGYFATLNMKRTAGVRLQAQQDLRNVSNMIVRDARMAGNFGCYNLSTGGTVVANQDAATSVMSTTNTHQASLKFQETRSGSSIDVRGNQYQGVRLLYPTWFRSNPSFMVSESSPALMFTYGVGVSSDYQKVSDTEFTFKTPENSDLAGLAGNTNAPLLLSNCSALSKFYGATKTAAAPDGNGMVQMTVTYSGLADYLAPFTNDNSVSVFRQLANIYVIGTPATTSKQGLYRYQLGQGGNWLQWSTPELLMEDVESMQVFLGYETCNGGSGTEQFTFEPANTIKVGADAASPTLLRLVLTKGSASAEAQQAGEQPAYIIDATLRGGNTCAERSLS